MTVSSSQLLHQRLAAGSQPGQHDDPYRLVMCIEGGGMRGAAVGGMVSAIQKAGGLDGFDAIYGTSAGAMAGAYLLSGQSEQGTALYWEALATRQFVRPWMLPAGRVLDLNFLFDEAIPQTAPLDWDKVAAHPIPLHPLLCRPLTAEIADARQVYGMDQAHTVQDALRAAVRVPGACGNPWVRGDSGWWDAALHEPVPYRLPIEQQATHMVLLRSMPQGVVASQQFPAAAQMVLGQAARFYQATCARWGIVNYKQMEQSFAGSEMPLEQIHPDCDLPIANFCVDQQELRAYAQAGERAMERWLEQALLVA